MRYSLYPSFPTLTLTPLHCHLTWTHDCFLLLLASRASCASPSSFPPVRQLSNATLDATGHPTHTVISIPPWSLYPSKLGRGGGRATRPDRKLDLEASGRHGVVTATCVGSDEKKGRRWERVRRGKHNMKDIHNVAVRAYNSRVSMARRVDEVSSTVSWALPGKSDHVLSR